MVDYQRQRQRQPLPRSADGLEPTAANSVPSASDQEFLAIRRAELMEGRWKAMKKHEQETGQHLYTVLRYQVDHPQMRSAQMAKQLSTQVSKPITAEWIYKRWHNARRKSTDLLVEKVACWLEPSTDEELEQERIELGLLTHCQDALERRGPL